MLQYIVKHNFFFCSSLILSFNINLSRFPAIAVWWMWLLFLVSNIMTSHKGINLISWETVLTVTIFLRFVFEKIHHEETLCPLLPSSQSGLYAWAMYLLEGWFGLGKVLFGTDYQLHSSNDIFSLFRGTWRMGNLVSLCILV